MIRHYRMDGSPYPEGDEGLFEWAKDFEDTKGRTIGLDLLWNGLWVSTVWLGLDHRFGREGPPLIFETMVFDRLGDFPWSDIDMKRYSELIFAETGHYWMCRKYSRVWTTLKLWWDAIRREYEREDC